MDLNDYIEPDMEILNEHFLENDKAAVLRYFRILEYGTDEIEEMTDDGFFNEL